MGRIGIGVCAGFIATVVLSISMIVKAFMHAVPRLNAIEMIHRLTGGPLAYGWLGHFFIGSVVWGVLFALLYRRLPGGNGLGCGLIFAVAAWLVMMLLFMPAVGAGVFAIKLGLPAAGLALGLHLIYGAVLGTCYTALGGR